MAPELSIVIPAFNEAERLAPTLETVTAYLERRGTSAEVLLVDDGSSDETAKVARSFEDRGVQVLEQGENRGKGAALRAGVAASSGAAVLLTDADLSTPIEDLERLEPFLAHAEVVMGSRAMPDSEISTRQPFYRELMGKVFNLLLRALGVAGFRDTQCGFKLLSGDVARSLFPLLTIERFAYDVELVMLAQRRGHRVVEVGVRWADSPGSRVHPVFDSMSMLWDVLRLRLRSLSRK